MLNALYTYSDSYSSVGHEIATGAIWFAGAMMFFGLLCLLAQILIAIAVYNDAMAKGNSEPVMWGVLTGLFGLIPAIIYLCVRNSNRNRLIVCQNCGFTHRISELNCPQCGIANPFAQQFSNPLTEIHKNRAKKLLIAGIIIWVVAFIVLIISLVWFLTAVVNTPGLAYAY